MNFLFGFPLSKPLSFNIFSVSPVGLAISYSFTTPASSFALVLAASKAAVTSATSPRNLIITMTGTGNETAFAGLF